jgi:hypothetical protein
VITFLPTKPTAHPPHFNPEDGGSMFLQNVSIYQLGCHNTEDHSLNHQCHEKLKTYENMFSLLQRAFMYYIFVGQTVNASI